MTELEKKIAEQLAEYAPTEIKIDMDSQLVDFKSFGRDYWVKLTPKCQGIKKNSVRQSRY